MLSLQLEIFLLLALGWFVAWKNLLSKSARTQLTSLVLSLVLPAAIIQSFELDLTWEEFRTMSSVLFCSIGIQVLYSLTAKLLWRHQPENQQISLRYGTLVSNAGFMGMPIAGQLYGSLGLLCASIFLIPQRIVMWSAGLALYTRADRRTAIRKVLLHPCIIALEIGVAVLLLRTNGILLPEPLDAAIHAVGSCNTALSMMMIGGMMADADKQNVFSPVTLGYSCIRLVALPLVIWFLLLQVPVPRLARQVCVVLSAMPAASTTGMLAQKYDRDPAFASRLIFVSTLLSMITLPFISWLVSL